GVGEAKEPELGLGVFDDAATAELEGVGERQRDHAPEALERGAVEARFLPRSGVDADGDEEMSFADDPGAGERGGAQMLERFARHVEAELLEQLASRGGEHAWEARLLRLDQPRGELPERTRLALG